MFKKTISVLLSVLLTAGLVPAGVLQAFADDSNGQITADYTLSLGSVTTVSVTEEGQAPYCAFTPAETAAAPTICRCASTRATGRATFPSPSSKNRLPRR